MGYLLHTKYCPVYIFTSYNYQNAMIYDITKFSLEQIGREK